MLICKVCIILKCIKLTFFIFKILFLLSIQDDLKKNIKFFKIYSNRNLKHEDIAVVARYSSWNILYPCW